VLRFFVNAAHLNKLTDKNYYVKDGRISRVNLNASEDLSSISEIEKKAVSTGGIQ